MLQLLVTRVSPQKKSSTSWLMPLYAFQKGRALTYLGIAADANWTLLMSSVNWDIWKDVLNICIIGMDTNASIIPAINTSMMLDPGSGPASISSSAASKCAWKTHPSS